MTQSFDAAMAAWAEHPPELPLGVAYSGGADSTALLMACHERWPGHVIALHVNHNLQLAASQFERHCRDFCQARGIALRVCQVDAVAARGDSPEDAARKARYKALVDLALMDKAQQAIKMVAIAQHADDQLESVLLALSRGSGMAGIAGMAPVWGVDGLAFCRPLLGVSGAGIRAWLREREIDFVEDPTNSDTRFLRNRIRHVLLPVMNEVFPHMAQAAARTARHAAQAQDLLDELAREDAQQLLDPESRALKIRPLQLLRRQRQANVLRWWLKALHGAIPASAQLDELLDQIRDCTTRGHRIHIKVGHGYAQRRGVQLHWYNPELLFDKK